MNPHRERRHLAALFSTTGVVLMALWMFGLHPAHRQIRQVQADIAALDESLSAFAQPDDEPPLDNIDADLRRVRRRLEAEYRRLREHVQTFSGESPIGDSLPTTEEGRIDFKVALHDARPTLLQNAAETGMTLPEQLGIQETIEEQEIPETRLWQLAALVKAVQACIRAGMPAVDAIEPLPPRVHQDDQVESVAFREYPVYLRMRGPFESAVLFLETIEVRGQFFALRSFLLENVSAAKDGTLKIAAVLSAGLDAVPAANERHTENAERNQTPDHSVHDRIGGRP